MEDTSPVSFPGPAGEAGLRFCCCPALVCAARESLPARCEPKTSLGALLVPLTHPHGTHQAQPPSPKVALSHLGPQLQPSGLFSLAVTGKLHFLLSASLSK